MIHRILGYENNDIIMFKDGNGKITLPLRYDVEVFHLKLYVRKLNLKDHSESTKSILIMIIKTITKNME